MMYRGSVKNGVVVFDSKIKLPESAKVIVKPVAARAKPAKPPKAAKKKAPPRTLAERYAKITGIAKGLPADGSVNMDHYVYGVPKQP
jgi:hypothetical protein